MIPIGVVAPPDLPAAEFTGYAADAERHGFDQLWVVEDCFFESASSRPPPGTRPSSRSR